MSQAFEHLKINYTRPKLYPKQEAAFFNAARYSWIEASTKAGKTVGAMTWILEKLMLASPNQNFWWVAPVYPVADIAYRRIKNSLRPREFYKYNDSRMTVTIPNNATLWFKSGEVPDNLYGENVYAGVVDEGSRVKADAFYALRSTVTRTRGQLRFIGNVKGRKNWFYEGCRRAEAGEPGHEYHRISADDAVEAKVLERAEIEDARRVLPESIFRELYYNEPSDDSGNPFGNTFISKCVAPMSTNKPICFGIDLAKSCDYTVVVGLDSAGTVCSFNRFQMAWNDTISLIHSIVGETQALVDSTGVGDPILEALQKKSREAGRENYEGFKFSSSTKQILMEGLAVAIQSGNIKFPTGPIEHELRSFEYQYTRTGATYSAPSGVHDDCVCALALAVNKYASMGKPVNHFRFEVFE